MKQVPINNEVYQTKKSMVMKDYDSLFNVYGRETNIVLLFRGWTITLLTGYYGFLMATKTDSSLLLINAIPAFIIFMFLILEVGERTVMIKLLDELRYLEAIFMETDEISLRKKIVAYKFRDIRDLDEYKTRKLYKNYFKTFLRPQILSWYPLMFTFNFLILIFILKQKNLI